MENRVNEASISWVRIRLGVCQHIICFLHYISNLNVCIYIEYLDVTD